MSTTNPKAKESVQPKKSYSPEEAQQAKDFIWEHLSDIAQSWWVSVATIPEEERKAKYTKKLFCYLSADVKDGVLTKEMAMLSAP